MVQINMINMHVACTKFIWGMYLTFSCMSRVTNMQCSEGFALKCFISLQEFVEITKLTDVSEGKI